MPAKKYIVDLNAEEQAQLEKFISQGKPSARQVIHARILLKANQGWTDAQIADALNAGSVTVERTRRRFVEDGMERAIKDRPRPGPKSKLSDKQLAQLTTLACSPAPGGRGCWTLRLLASAMVELGFVDSVSHETVREALKKTNFSRGATRNGASPKPVRIL